MIPSSVTLSALFDLGMTLLAVFVFLLILGVYPDWGWLELIPLVGMLTVFATGLGLLLSVLFVRFRDIKPIWDVVGQMLFYASPILYVATIVPGGVPAARTCSTRSPSVLTQMRHAVIDPARADRGGRDRRRGAAADPARRSWSATFALGLWAFMREAPRVAENL